MADLLSAAPDAEAVFCNNDDVALGALFECQRRGHPCAQPHGDRGLQRSRHFRLFGAHDHPIRTHRYDMGHRAVEMILAALDGDPAEAPVIDLGVHADGPAEQPATGRKENMKILILGATAA